MAVMNVTTYGFTILAARLLGPAEYGALAAVMGVLLVVNVLSLGLQATGARRVSASPQDLPEIERDVMATSYVSALVLGALLLLATPVITSRLSLDSWGAAALIAVTVVPLSIMGGQAGILQGERRWGPLAGIYLAVGVGRLGFGVVGLVVERDTLGAMVGVAAGAFLPVVVGALALRHPDRRGPHVATGPTRRQRASRWAAGGVLRETMHNSHALLAFFALSNTDVIVARSTLPEHQAGLYAGGLILTKAVLFLPQFVVVIAFPSMSRQGSGRRMHLLGLGMVLGIGAVTVVGVALLSSLTVLFVGGHQYAALQDRLWVFAVLGTLLAMLQLMIYDVVARQQQRMVYVVWAGMVGLLCAAPFLGSVTALLTTVVSIDGSLFAVLLLASVHPTARPETPSRPTAPVP
jgi:O-antigen/teichoic acid export membrane protein